MPRTLLSRFFSGAPASSATGAAAPAAPAATLAVVQGQLLAATRLADEHRARADKATTDLQAMTAERDRLTTELATANREKEAAVTAKADHEATFDDRVKSAATALAAGSGIPPKDTPKADTSGGAETIDSLRAQLASSTLTPEERGRIGARLRVLRAAA